MDWNALLAPVARYTVLTALVTVGTAYFVFSSGLTFLLLAGTGVIFVVLGAAEAGAAPASGVGAAESGGVGTFDADMGAIEEGMQLVPGIADSGAHYSLRAKLLFYGLGLLVWAISGLAILLR